MIIIYKTLLRGETEVVSFKIKQKNMPLIKVCIIAGIYIMKNIYFIRNSTGIWNGLDVAENMIYILVLFEILFFSYKTKQFIIIVGCVTALFLCYLHTGQADLLKGFIVIVSLHNLSEEDVFSFLKMVYFFGIIMTVALYITGISNPGLMRRNGVTLGFATTNIASRLFQIALFFLVVSHKKIKNNKRFIFVICIIAGIFTYALTKSRLSAILMIAYPFLLILIEKGEKSKIKWLWKTMAMSMPVAMLLFSVLLTSLYANNSIVQAINLAFSNRIYMNLVALQKYGITVFGTAADISSFSGIYDSVAQKHIYFLTIDSQYIYLIVYYGIIGMAIVISSVIICIEKAWNSRNNEIVTILLLMSVYMLTETIGSIFGFPFLVYLILKPTGKGMAIQNTED